MITGRKHAYCGRINWEGKNECICRPYGNDKAIYQFTDVVLDNPIVEEIGKKVALLAKKLGMRVKIEYDVEHDNEDGDTVGAVIIDGAMIIYPEKIPFETFNGVIYHDGYALDGVVIEYNYPSEPDFQDYTRINTSTYIWNIIAQALNFIWKNRLDNIIEGIGMKEMKEKHE